MKLVITLIASIYASRASAFMIAPVINTNLSSKTNTMSLKMGFFDQFFPNKDEVEIEEIPSIPDVVVDPNSNLSILFGAIGIIVLATSPGEKRCSMKKFVLPLIFQANVVMYLFDRNNERR